MTTKAVRFWKLIGSDTYEPHSTSVHERNQLMHYRGNEGWCPHCEAVVEPVEMIFNASIGYVPACPWCEVAI